MSATTRLTLATPIDVARAFDHTVTQDQIDANTFQGTGDDADTLASKIETAEDEFRRLANVETRVSRVGIPDQRETFEEVTYKLSGHKQYRRSFSHATFDYSFREGTVSVANDRLMPFDPAEDDAVYIFAGLDADDAWVDITDERGETWDIVNYRRGRLSINPNYLRREHAWFGPDGLRGPSRQRNIRLAISYRHGQLGRSRSRLANTSLGESVDDTQTDAVGVADASVIPRGVAGPTQTLLIDREYVTATLDRENDQIVITERGTRGTTPTSHDADARVQYVPPMFRKAVTARAAMSLIEGGRYAAWLPDADDSIDKSELYDDFEETWNTIIQSASGFDTAE